jgi:hypothetical protein
MVCSLALAGGAVSAAHYYTSSHGAPASLAATDATAAGDWQDDLASVQAQSGVTLPDAPSEDTVTTVLKNAESKNLTDTVGRQLLVKLANAGTQGLGDDIPTQDTIVAEAAAQINTSVSSRPPPSITTTESTPLSLRAYGNEVITIMDSHPKANSGDTLLTLAKATDVRDASLLAPLTGIGLEYRALAADLAAEPVPATLAPLHKQVVANFSLMADTYPDMLLVVDDPLRGLAALQQYEQLLSETGRVLTNMAQALKNGGILFSKDEPGAAWDIFLSAS